MAVFEGAEPRLSDPLDLASDRLSALQVMTSALGRTRDVADVADVVIEKVAGTLDAQSASLLMYVEDAHELRMLAVRGYSTGVRDQWASFAVDLRTPAGECVRTRRPIFLATLAERDARYPVVAGRPSSSVTSAVIPLLVDDRVVGVLALGWETHREFGAADRDYLSSVAGQCAQALDRARLYDAERAARAAAERSQERLRFLAEASEILGSSLDYEATLTAVARLVVPALADMVAVHLADDRGLRFVTVAHVVPEKQDIMTAIRDGQDSYSQSAVVRQVYESGEAAFSPVADPVTRSQTLPEGPGRALFAQLVGVSAMTIPLTSRGRVVGVLSLATTRDASARTYTTDDVEIAVDLGRRIGAAVDNARSHQSLADVAVELQRSLLPTALPDVPSLRVAHRYVAGAAETQVGGDWYDVIALSADRVGVVIGDVMGRGVRAAAVMGQLRVGVRAYAALDPPPEMLLQYLDTLVHGIDDAALVTGVYGVYEPGLGRFTFANAGHLPPMIAGPDGVTTLSEAQSVPLGVGGFPFTSERVQLPPGATLLLFTDGLVESPARSVDDGMALVADVLRDVAGDDMEVLADAVFAALRPARGFADDAALLALHLVGTPVDTIDGVSLPALASAAAEGRRFVVDTLVRWGFHGSIDEAALLTSEVVTNAIRHAPIGDVRVHVRRSGEVAYIEVADNDPRLPQLHRSTADEEGGRGLFLIDALSMRWGARLEGRGKVVWFAIPA
ncbi:MAG: hypothetical protein QOG52_1232 [Frankiaceae bacterium]|nr:hypothetical protein [Frankiaceae bacterium]